MLKKPTRLANESATTAAEGVSIIALVMLPVREAIGRFKYTPNDQLQAEYDGIAHRITRVTRWPHSASVS